MKKLKFPRVLFITPCAFNHITGGGVTFSNLFLGWPKEYLATITDDTVPVTNDVCEDYYFLSDAERSYIFPVGLLFKRKVRQHISKAPLRNEKRNEKPVGKLHTPS